MKAKIVVITLFLNIILTLNSLATKSTNNSLQFTNSTFKDEIKTVRMYTEGNVLSDPIIELNGDAVLTLNFDDLSGVVKSYNYTIVHCDANWNESFITQSEYMDGFYENPMNDYAMSINTTFKYINYQLNIPNEDVKLKLSGNYAVIVFEGTDVENVVLTRRFYVLEPQVRIEGNIKKATFDPFKGDNQEVDFSIYHESFKITDPTNEIKVVLMQNRRWDNAIRNLKPLFIKQNVLEYNYDKENVFPGGNEFRFFDIRTTEFPGENVASIEFIRPYYHITLIPDELRTTKKFYAYKEMNGKYAIESRRRIVDDPNTECDYFFVHFELPLEAQLIGGSVNVFGSFTDWTTNKTNEMIWSFDHAAYELTMLLKEGYYNYQYVYVSPGSKIADAVNFEGSHYETENDYQVYVYYKSFSDRYDRLIGYTLLNRQSQNY